MSGLLDNKSRVMDTIITLEGRRQMAQGKLRIEFVSFTDGETFYEGDVASGSSEPSERLLFEAASLPSDQITFEADDSGRLVAYRGTSLGVLDGKVLSGSSDSYLSVVTGSEFTSTAETLLASSIDNFKKLRAIATDDAVFDDEREFVTNVDSIEFNIGDEVPFGPNDVQRASVDDIENLMQDKRLSHVLNFKYLPPINRPDAANVAGSPLGDFPRIGQRLNELTYDELIASLEKKEERVVEFVQTSKASNVICQVFELQHDRLLKLDAIDFGDVVTDDAEFPEKRVFFVGKVFIDGWGAQTFVNVFTIIYE